MERKRAKGLSNRDTSQIIRSGVGRHEKQNKHTKVKQSTSDIELPGLHLLSKHLKSKTYLEIEYALGRTIKNRSISGLDDYTCLVNTEKKRLQVIKDLYQIVKAQPQYHNLKEPEWTANTHTIEVIAWLCKKLSPLAKGEYWYIDKRLINGKLKHVFVVLDYYHSQVMDFGWFTVPLEFLPLLAKKDKDLHDIIVAAVALVHKHNHVPLWDEYEIAITAHKMIYIEQDVLNNTMSERKADSLSIYETGMAATYLKLIKKTAKTFTVDSINKLIKEYNPDSERKRLTLYWVKELISLLSFKERITQFNNHVHYAKPSKPFVASDKYAFVWSVHKHDEHSKYMDRVVHHREVKSGRFLPVQVSVTAPGEQYVSPVQSKYPIVLHAAMKLGWSLIMTRFQSYHLGKSMQEPNSLSLQLLNKEKYATKRNKRKNVSSAVTGAL